MKCPWPDCNGQVAPDDTFCGTCGRKVADAPQATNPSPGPTPEIMPSSPPPGPPASVGTYSAQITRKNPGCLLFLVDQSGSMEEPIAGSGGQKKKDTVTDAINRLLYNTVLRCTKSEDLPWPYFDIGLWTYGGTGLVRRAFDGDLVSIADIPARVLRTETRKRRAPDGAGGVYEEEMPFPIWVEPVASGLTPMNAAFRTVVAPLRDWISRHQDSFPPIILNLTDGAYSDESPAPVIWEMMQMRTADGGALVFNCHISQQEGNTLAFPDASQAAALTGLARELYDMSSPLPDIMRQMAGSKGYNLQPGSRGYAFNADVITMIDFLDVGTRAVQDRMEVPNR